MGKFFFRPGRAAANRRHTEFMPAALQVLDRPPAPLARLVVGLIGVLAVLVCGWAWLARIDIVASASGTVVPQGRAKTIQAPAGARVSAILVRDGQEVAAGQVLIRLDPTECRADLQRMEEELNRIHLALGRVRALLAAASGTPVSRQSVPPPDPGAMEDQVPAGQREAAEAEHRLLRQILAARAAEEKTLEEQIKSFQARRETALATIEWLSKTLKLAGQLNQRKEELYRRDALSEAEVIQSRMGLMETGKELERERKRLRELTVDLARARDEKILAAEKFRQGLLEEQTRLISRRDQLVQERIKAKKRLADLTLRAPVHGIVQQLAVATLGGVVTPAQPLMTIVPVDRNLEVEARVLNRDIGFIRAGQPVSVKVAAFPFTRHGDLDGVIDWVGRDAVVDREQGPVYPVRIRLLENRLPNRVNGRHGRVKPGMQVSVDIRVGSRRVLDYFLGPILRYRDTALREM